MPTFLVIMSKNPHTQKQQQVVQQMCEMFTDLARDECDKIKTEEEEKANENFQQVIDSTQNKLDDEFHRETLDTERTKKIRTAQIQNNVNLEILKAQTEAIHEALKEAIVQLNAFSTGPKYPELLKELIAEGLDRLCEPRVRLMFRKADLQIAKDVLPEAIKIVQARHPDLTIKVKIDEKNYLPAAPNCAGGVILICQKGRIRISNVLNDRLRLAYEGLLPVIRQYINEANKK